MRTMFLKDKLILYTICLFLYSMHDIRVEALIMSVIALGLMTYYESDLFKLIVLSIYTFLAIKFNALLYFIPVLIYGAYDKNPFFWPLLFVLPALFIDQNQGLFIAILGGIAIWLKHKSLALSDFRQELLQLSDDKRELERNSQLKTQMLIEKQDNDIHLATLNERNRIAREIHDHVGHQLSSAILQVGALRIAIPNQKGLETLNKTLGTAMDQIRRSVHNLYETSVELEQQIQSLVESFDFCKIHFKHNLQTIPTPNIKYALIAIVKEALSNVMKHSNASLVDITLVEHPAFYQLIVSDNGSEMPSNQSPGIGLHSIEQRTLSLNGHFRIRTAKGFELFITLPKE